MDILCVVISSMFLFNWYSTGMKDETMLFLGIAIGVLAFGLYKSKQKGKKKTSTTAATTTKKTTTKKYTAAKGIQLSSSTLNSIHQIQLSYGLSKREEAIDFCVNAVSQKMNQQKQQQNYRRSNY